MLIRLLCDSKYLMSDSTCTAIATVVVDALARKTDNNVQSEVRTVLTIHVGVL